MAYACSFSMNYHSLPLALLILLWGVVLASSGPAPASLDWRKSGVVTPVKNQRLCDHSWAFAAVSLVESALLFNSSTPRGLDLSEQQVLDCSNGRGNLGCITGTVLDALNYIKTRGGLFTELQYLYNGVSTGDCSQPLGTLVSTLGLKQYLMDRSNETALAASLAIYGPAVVTICPPFNLDTYSGGIYYNGNCHANCDYVDRISMTLVGYGTEQGVDYWILKNSWGTLWGERGYIKLLRGRNMCGILNNPSYFIPRN